MILRIQTKVSRLVINSLTEDSTLEGLQKLLEKKTGVPPRFQKILCGYPPRQLLSSNPQATLHSLHINSGETLILEVLSEEESKKKALTENPSQALLTREFECKKVVNSTNDSSLRDNDTNALRINVQLEKKAMNYQLKRRAVPADNSCLFKTISILLCDGKESTMQLRELVGGLVLSDPSRYTTALLGQENQDYVDWLLKEESWGGAIEVSVFSDYYQTELDIVDIQTQRIDKFGEDRCYSSRALLLYDGIHYDPLLIEGAGSDIVQTVFPVTDESVLTQAVQIAKYAFQAHQFTDLAGFSLKCLVCGKGLTGQADAQSHAKSSGHINFGEV